MPQVPYQPYPTAQPTEAGPGGVHPQVPGAAFGETVATAIRGLGEQFEKSGGEIFREAVNLQQLQNETDARNGALALAGKIDPIHAKFNSLQGTNAGPEALGKYKDDLQAAWQEVRSSLKTDQARKMYDAQATPQILRSLFNGAGHSASELHEANKKSIDASINLGLNRIYNEGFYEGWQDDLNAELVRKNQAEGWDSETLEAMKHAYGDKAVANYLIGKSQRGKTLEALEEYEQKYKGTLDENVDLRVAKTLQANAITSFSRIETEKELSNVDSTEALEARRDKVIQAVEKRFPDDQNAGWRAANMFDTVSGKHRAVQKAQDAQDQSILNKVITANQVSDPAMIESGAYGEAAKQAWERVGLAGRKRWLAGMKEIAKGDHWETQENIAEYQRLKGMSRTDPAKFVQEDILTAANGTLTNRQRADLIDRQEKVNLKAEEDPRMSQALTYLRSKMLRDKIWKAGQMSTGEKNTYDQFTGALHDAIKLYQQDTKAPPKHEDLDKIYNRVMQEQVTGHNWLGFETKARFFQAPDVTDAYVRKAQQEAVAAGQPKPSPNDIRRAVARSQYRTMYEKSDIAGATAP